MKIPKTTHLFEGSASEMQANQKRNIITKKKKKLTVKKNKSHSLPDVQNQK